MIQVTVLKERLVGMMEWNDVRVSRKTDATGKQTTQNSCLKTLTYIEEKNKHDVIVYVHVYIHN